MCWRLVLFALRRAYRLSLTPCEEAAVSLYRSGDILLEDRCCLLLDALERRFADSLSLEGTLCLSCASAAKSSLKGNTCLDFFLIRASYFFLPSFSCFGTALPLTLIWEVLAGP